MRGDGRKQWCRLDSDETYAAAIPSYLCCPFQVPRPREVEGQLHGGPGFGRGAKCLRQAVGHFNRDGGLFVDQVGKSLTSTENQDVRCITNSLRPLGLLLHIGRDSRRDSRGRCLHGLSRKVGVASRGLHLTVSE